MSLVKSCATVSATLPTADHAAPLLRQMDAMKDELYERSILVAYDTVGSSSSSDLARGFILDLAMTEAEHLEAVGGVLEQVAAKLADEGIELEYELASLHFHSRYSA